MIYVLPIPEWLRFALTLFFILGLIAGIMNLYYATREILDHNRKRKKRD